jgi:hypothetical protein
MTTSKKPAMSDLERVTRSYSTGSQSYTPAVNDQDSKVTRSEDQEDPKRGPQCQPPSRA